MSKRSGAQERFLLRMKWYKRFYVRQRRRFVLVFHHGLVGQLVYMRKYELPRFRFR